MSCCKNQREDNHGCQKNNGVNSAFIILILYILLAIILGGILF